MAQLLQVHAGGKFASGRILKTCALTWLGGNTISDLLIASAMFYHSTRVKARGHFSNQALVSIVRLTPTLDADKIRRVLEGKAVVSVVVVE